MSDSAVSDLAGAPLVSIGMPVFNAARYLERAIDSLLAQDYKNFELIISDNASTDNTYSLCERYAAQDSRIRLYRNEVNQGAVANFRAVQKLAEGQYFMWAAGDDFWSPGYISGLINLHVANPGSNVAAGSICHVDVHGDPVPRRDCDPAPPMPYSPVECARVFLSRQICSWIYGVYDRKLLESVIARLWSERPWGGDAVFVLYLCLNTRVLGDDRAVLYKRLGSTVPLKPPNKRSMAAWQVWYARTMSRQILSSPLSLLSRLRLFIYLAAHLRMIAGGVINLVIVWVRAGIEIARGQRGFDDARTGL